LDEARAALHSVAAADLAKLPSDRDILGTLGHVARAALALNSTEYAAALYALLARHRDDFAAGIAFFCEGSVQQLLGMLAPSHAGTQVVIDHYEAAIAANDGAGFALRAIEARLQLARCLSNDPSPAARRRATGLMREVSVRAARLELPSQQQEADAMLLRA
jgi:hypothetical protein